MDKKIDRAYVFLPVPDGQYATLIQYQSEDHLHDDIKELGPDLEELGLDLRADLPKGRGVWYWEGDVVPLEETEWGFTTEWRGKWSRPSDGDALAVAKGELIEGFQFPPNV